MVERSLSMREVPGSIPGASTIFFMKVHQNSALPSKTDVHRPGIEPGPPAWQASILPLNQRCFLLGVMKKLGPTAMLNVGRGRMGCVSQNCSAVGRIRTYAPRGKLISSQSP